jgi:hypothetical protein
MSDWITKDSGQRDEYETGARRDTQVGKDRYDLIPVSALKRLAGLYARGAEKYGEGNFEKGIPFSRVYASMFRHMMQWREGDRTEDHLAAVAWNAFALMFYEEEGMTEMDDLFQQEDAEEEYEQMNTEEALNILALLGQVYQPRMYVIGIDDAGLPY